MRAIVIPPVFVDEKMIEGNSTTALQDYEKIRWIEKGGKQKLK